MNKVGMHFALSTLALMLGCTQRADGNQAEAPELCLTDCGDNSEPAPYSLREDADYIENIATFDPPTVEVYDGFPVDPGELDAVVALTAAENDGDAKCTGNLIGPRLIVTAGHCCASQQCELRFAHFGEDVDAPSIRLQPIVRFPDAVNGKIPDVALLRLTQPPRNIEPIALAPGAWIGAAKAVRVAGFGLTETGDVGKKRKGDVGVASYDCLRDDGGVETDADRYGCNPNYEMVAAARTGRTDTCDRDSGGGAFVAPPASAAPHEAFAAAFAKRQYAIAAITSRKIKRSRNYRDRHPERALAECGDGGVYVRLDGPIYEWIKNTAAEWGETVRLAEDRP